MSDCWIARTWLVEVPSVGSFGTYRCKYPGYFKQSLFSANEYLFPLNFNQGNVRGARCIVGGAIVGPYLRIYDKNILQRYVDCHRSANNIANGD